VAKRAAIMIGRYSHAHQFKRARRAMKFLRIRLGRVIRDIRRKIDGNEALKVRFADLLALAHRVRFQDHRQRGPKIYALHAPEVECIGKGKARAPYEFGCKVSIATPATKPKGGQFVLHTKALHGNPFDGHTLGPVITELEQQTGVETRRIHVDKGYRGHNHKQKFRVWISGQVRRVTAPIRREMKRRAAVEPVIGAGQRIFGENRVQEAKEKWPPLRARHGIEAGEARQPLDPREPVALLPPPFRFEEVVGERVRVGLGEPKTCELSDDLRIVGPHFTKSLRRRAAISRRAASYQ